MSAEQQLSRQLSRYRGSARFAVTQSDPVRKSVGALGNARRTLTDVARFYSGALQSLSVHKSLLLLTVLAYGAQQAAGQAATLAGARMNVAITRGNQWHRLVSPIFLHGGGMHLASNALSTWRVGPLVEAAFGPTRTLLIYLLSGIGGNVAGLVWGSPRGLSVGASGAVFGLMGATAAFVLRNKRQLGNRGDALLQSVGQVLLLNLFIGTRRGSGIDNLGHVGGCVAGAVLGLAMAPRVGSRAADGDGDGDGSLLPPPLVRALLGGTVCAVGLALRDAVRLTITLRRLAPA